MEDKESTESGSLGGNSESESPPVSGGDFGGGVFPGGGAGGFGGSGFGGVNLSVEGGGVGVMTSGTQVAVGGGPGGVTGGGVVSGYTGGVISGGVVSGFSGGGVTGGGVVGGFPGGGGGVISGGDASGGGGGGVGSGDMVKKKRGRPRKYDADGNLNVQYMRSQASGGGGVQTPPSAGFSLSPAPPSGYSSGTKRGRGRPAGSGNWQILASLGELFANTAGGDFTPHVMTVHTGEDVAGKILTFAQKGRGICILSANGTVSNVTIRQPGSSGGLLTYEGRFEILTLSGSYTITENGGLTSRTGGLSVSLASPDGRVIGGGIAGSLVAASPIQVVVGTFTPNAFKPQKKKYHSEPRMAPIVQASPAVTAATPISQAAPVTNMYPVQNTQLPVQSQGETDNSSKENLNSASTDTADCNGSDPISNQRPSPDINVSLHFE